MSNYIVKEYWNDGVVTYLSSRMWSTTDIKRAHIFKLDELRDCWEFIKPRKSRKITIVVVSRCTTG